MIDETEKNKSKLIFFDPPYFNSNNTDYQYMTKNDTYRDGTTIYIDIFNYFKQTNNKVIFIMNKIDVINYIFKDYYNNEYHGSYQNTGSRNINTQTRKKSVKHHIVYTKNI